MNKSNNGNNSPDQNWFKKARETGKWLPTKIGPRFIAARGDLTVSELQRDSGITDSVIIRSEQDKQLPNLHLLAYYWFVKGVSPATILFGAASSDLLNQSSGRGLSPKQALQLELLALDLPEKDKIRLAARLLEACVSQDGGG